MMAEPPAPPEFPRAEPPASPPAGPAWHRGRVLHGRSALAARVAGLAVAGAALLWALWQVWGQR